MGVIVDGFRAGSVISDAQVYVDMNRVDVTGNDLQDELASTDKYPDYDLQVDTNNVGVSGTILQWLPFQQLMFQI